MKPSVPENQKAGSEGKVISSQTLYRGKEISFRVDEVVLPNGRRSVEEMLIYPATVCIAAYTNKGHFVLVKQYRHSTGTCILEAPAGKLLPGEEPEAGARRELEEETGCRAEQWEHLFSGYTAPGISTEWMSFYLARRLVLGSRNPDADECIRVQEVPAESVRQMLNRGEIQDVKTALALMLALERL